MNIKIKLNFFSHIKLNFQKKIHNLTVAMDIFKLDS